MKIHATTNNVILKVPKKVKSIDELLIETGEQEQILIGHIVSVGPDSTVLANSECLACAYLNRVALLPWATETDTYYVVKEENIYGILEA
jgi:hypothetical protein